MTEIQRLALTSHTINYDLLQHVLNEEAPTLAGKQQLILDELPYSWEKHYRAMTSRPTNPAVIEFQGFLYYYDNYTEFELKRQVEYSETIEDRVFGVIGRSVPREGKRSKEVQSWLAGLIGGTNTLWGKQYDKGHFVADSLGGGVELNIFPQRRDLNRGWSEPGKIFREMESYCQANAGTLFFHRPIYKDESFKPIAMDFGFLRADGFLWVQRFDNTEVPVDGELHENHFANPAPPQYWTREAPNHVYWRPKDQE